MMNGRQATAVCNSLHFSQLKIGNSSLPRI